MQKQTVTISCRPVHSRWHATIKQRGKVIFTYRSEKYRNLSDFLAHLSVTATKYLHKKLVATPMGVPHADKILVLGVLVTL